MKFKLLREETKQQTKITKWLSRIRNEQHKETEIKRAKRKLSKREFKLLCQQLETEGGSNE